MVRLSVDNNEEPKKVQRGVVSNQTKTKERPYKAPVGGSKGGKVGTITKNKPYVPPVGGTPTKKSRNFVETASSTSPSKKGNGGGADITKAFDLLRYGPSGKKPDTSGFSMVPEKSDLEKLISELQNQTKEGFTWEDQAREQQMIDQIFGSQLSQIANARNSTNSRFAESTAKTRDLYQGHENEVRGADRAIYEGIANQAKTATNETFDQGINTMQDAQSKNRAESEEMMSRLGLQASAPLAVETANEQQKAIDDLAAAKVSSQKQNDSYAASDLRRNDARAQYIADESVTKQADLSRQLEDILGELGNKEADVNSAKAEALYGAYGNAKSEWRSDREYATSSLAQLMEAQAKSSQDSAGGMNAPAMSNVLASLGLSDPALQQKYQNAYTDAVLNAKYYPGQQDQTSVYLNHMRKENPDLDPNVLLGLTQGNLSYGTYRPGTPMS